MMTGDEIHEKLKNIIDVACMEGNYNYDPYMHGMANGLICAMSVLTGDRPEYINAPEHWLSEAKNKTTKTIEED